MEVRLRRRGKCQHFLTRQRPGKLPRLKAPSVREQEAKRIVEDLRIPGRSHEELLEIVTYQMRGSISDLLDMERIETGTLSVNPAPTEVVNCRAWSVASAPSLFCLT